MTTTTADKSQSTYRHICRENGIKVFNILLLLAIAVSVLTIQSRGSPRLVYDHYLFVAVIGVAVVLASVSIISPFNRALSALAAGISVVGLVAVTLLPYFGSHMIHGRSDTVYHFQQIRLIETTGSVPDSLIYPIFHVFSAHISILWGISPHKAVYLTVAILAVFGVLGLALAFRELSLFTISSWQAVCGATVLVLAFPFNIYHMSYYPIGLALFIFPIILYISIRIIDSLEQSINPDRRKVGVLSVFGLVILFAHPVSFIMFALLLVVIEGYARYADTKYNRSFGLFLFGIMGYQWYWHVGTIQHGLIDGIQTLFLTPDTETQTSWAVADLPFMQFLVMKYGFHLSLFVLTLIGFYVVFIAQRRTTSDNNRVILLWGGIMGITGFALFIASSLLGPMRVVDGSPAIWVSFLVLAVLATQYKDLLMKARFVVIPVFSVVIISSMILAFPSPATYQYNWDTPYSDPNSVEWAYQHTSWQNVEGVGIEGRVVLAIPSSATEVQSGFGERFDTASQRAAITDRGAPKVYSADPYDSNSIDQHVVDQLVIISEWNTRHAESERLRESREFPHIAWQFDEDGVTAFENEVNKIHTNGKTRTYRQ